MDIKNIKSKIEEGLKGELFEDVEIYISENEKKVDRGIGSITVDLGWDDNNASITLYMMEKSKSTTSIFVDNTNHDMVFSNFSHNSIEIAITYLIRYIERMVKKFKGIPIEYEKKERKDRNGNFKKNRKNDR